jgi:hypothetical protein
MLLNRGNWKILTSSDPTGAVMMLARPGVTIPAVTTTPLLPLAGENDAMASGALPERIGRTLEKTLISVPLPGPEPVMMLFLVGSPLTPIPIVAANLWSGLTFKLVF